MPERLTLLELNTMLRSAIYTAFPTACWVEAELVSLRQNNDHCYMEVCQKEGESLVASARATCWRNSWSAVAKKFSLATGALPTAGMKLLFEARLNYHPVYGLSLTVSDIDPTYTLGEMAARREAVIRRLRSEGLFTLQTALSLPLFAQHIAVISSPTAAGYQDFCKQLTANAYGVAFSITLFPALMQGEQTTASILAALAALSARQEEFDCVVIIRGGGATTDLACFDSYELAAAAAQCPLPVITGIGHDRDECVVDLVAYYKAKTPTAAATFLLEHLLATLARVQQAQKTILAAAQLIYTGEVNRVKSVNARITAAAQIYCTREASKVKSLSLRLTTAAQLYCARQESIVANISSRLLTAAQFLCTWETSKVKSLNSRILAAAQIYCTREASKVKSLNSRILAAAQIYCTREASKVKSLSLRLTTAAQLYCVRQESIVANISSRLLTAAQFLCTREMNKVKSISSRILSTACLLHNDEANKFAALRLRLRSALHTMLREEHYKINLLRQRFAALSPQRVLERGYTLTTVDKHIVRHAGEVHAGQEIETIFADGRVKSTIVQD